MGDIFDVDGTLLRGLTKIADLMILNIIFLITCIPIFTIGAALTAMYEITLKMVKNEEAYIIKSYFQGFRSNFKKSTIVWMVYVLYIIIALIDLRIATQLDGEIWTVMYTLILGFSIAAWWYFGMIFPFMSKFNNTIKNTIINVGYLTVRHILTSFLVMIFNSMLIILIYYNEYTFVYGLLAYLVIGFAAIAYTNSTLLVKTFEKYSNTRRNNC